MTSTAQPAAEGTPKSALFCPNCTHRSRYDGDWVCAETAGTRHYDCPECGTEIAARPVGPGTDTTHPTATFWQTWEESLNAWREFWYRVLRHG
ncbi:hypothetical protein [Salinibaculum rarum]|uniref:hypothetical protein n=1 Tax=Salinibaculum rarum TaxID=3058903 RepID=UPI00265F737F|nr:hypothetical protein [Salinibaculum sp. KK48]